MRVKIVNVSNKNSQGYKVLNEEANCDFIDNKLYLSKYGYDGEHFENKFNLRTSTIKKITVEANNTTYELEVI